MFDESIPVSEAIANYQHSGFKIKGEVFHRVNGRTVYTVIDTTPEGIQAMRLQTEREIPGEEKTVLIPNDASIIFLHKPLYTFRSSRWRQIVRLHPEVE
jgi:hypothetical protein